VDDRCGQKGDNVERPIEFASLKSGVPDFLQLLGEGGGKVPLGTNVCDLEFQRKKIWQAPLAFRGPDAMEKIRIVKPGPSLRNAKNSCEQVRQFFGWSADGKRGENLFVGEHVGP
jgi:hypothetical protein